MVPTRTESRVRRAVLAAAALAAAIAFPASAAVVGPGLVSNAGNDSGDRLNIDDSFSQLLPAGNYSVDNFFYNSTGAGNVVPFLASGDGTTYQLLWIGGNAAGAAGTTVTAPTGGHIRLSAPTTVYAGFYTAGGRVAFTATPGQVPRTDHNGTVTVPRGGVAINAATFSNPNLERTYAFGVTATPTNHLTVGPGLLSTDGADTAGENRLNVDQQNALNLAAGTYDVTDFSFNGTRASGTVVPFLARLTANNTYQTVWVGEGAPGLVGNSRTDPTGGFTLAGAETLYAGYYTTGSAAVAFTEAAGRPPGFGLTDHDNAFTGPTAAGQTVDGFSNADLARQYSFEISVAVPEPGVAGLVVAAGAAMLRRRRR